MSEKYKSLKVKELQELLQKSNLSVSGKKEDLIARLVKNDERIALESLEKEFELDGNFDDSKLNLSDISHDMFAPIPIEKSSTIEKESVLSDDDEVDFVISQKSKEPVSEVKESSESTTVTVQVSITPETKPKDAAPADEKKEITAAKVNVSAEVKNSFKFTPITFDKPTVSSAGKAVSKPETPKKIEPVKKVKTKLDESAEKLRLEAERRLERSKRFGLKLDEKEMKQIRAARFGLIDKEKKKPESPEEILKRRAERFGLPLEKVQKEAQKEVEKETKKVAKKEVKKVIKKEVKKEAKKDPVDQKKKVVQKRALALNKVQKGRVSKPSTSSNVGNKVTMTKANVLSTKQQNVNKLAEGTIRQTKKNIINQRKSNIPNTINKSNGRIITIQTKPTTKKETIPLIKKISNGRHIEIQQLPRSAALTINRNNKKVIVNPDNKHNPTSDKQASKKRAQSQTITANKKRRS